MRSFAFGQYYPARSVLHRLDPRSKVLAAVIYIVAAFLCKNTISFALLLLSGLVLMLISRIPVKVIRIGMYVRMLIALIPAFLLVGLAAVLIFTSPTFNAFFVYLYGWQYALIFVGMILLTVRTTYKQIRRLFGESVKKSLKGGSAQ